MLLTNLKKRAVLSRTEHRFKFENLEARGDIFEEFYYDPQSLSVLKYQPVDKTYTVGDKIPTEGESYKYPDSFDIIVLRDGVTVKVRNKKIGDIIEQRIMNTTVTLSLTDAVLKLRLIQEKKL